MPPLEAGSVLSRAFAGDNISFVRNDWPQGRDLRVADFLRIHRKDVVDLRRLQGREAMEGVELVVLGG